MNCKKHPERHGAFVVNGEQVCTECHINSKSPNGDTLVGLNVELDRAKARHQAAVVADRAAREAARITDEEIDGAWGQLKNVETRLKIWKEWRSNTEAPNVESSHREP